MTEKLPAYNNTKKIFVHFKFKDDITEYREWLTYRQFVNLSEVKCIEFCKILQRSDVKTKGLNLNMNKITMDSNVKNLVENDNLKTIGFSSNRKLEEK